jgi:hypothetical protein
MWWKENSFGIAPDDWMRLIKYQSHGATNLIWSALSEENREPGRFEAICAELRLSDLGRCGFSETEAHKQLKDVSE